MTWNDPGMIPWVEEWERLMLKSIFTACWHEQPVVKRIGALGAMMLLGLVSGAARPGGEGDRMDSTFEQWLKPQEWKRDSDMPALSLGEKGRFDDQHIFAPHVIFQNGEYWMYYCGSQRCVDAGVYKGVAQDPAHPEKSDQRLFKLGLAKSKDGVHFTRFS